LNGDDNIFAIEGIGMIKTVTWLIRLLVLGGGAALGFLAWDRYFTNRTIQQLVAENGQLRSAIQNLTEESIERVRAQVEPVFMIDTEDVGSITAKIKELVSKDPGALDVEPMRIEIKEAGEEAAETGPMPMAAEVVEIRDRMRLMDAAVTNNGLLNKFQAGIYAGKIEGIALGMTMILVFFGIILKMVGGS